MWWNSGYRIRRQNVDYKYMGLLKVFSWILQECQKVSNLSCCQDPLSSYNFSFARLEQIPIQALINLYKLESKHVVHILTPKLKSISSYMFGNIYNKHHLNKNINFQESCCISLCVGFPFFSSELMKQDFLPFHIESIRCVIHPPLPLQYVYLCMCVVFLFLA